MENNTIINVKITNVITSLRILKEAEDGKHLFYLGCDLGDNAPNYGWAFRVHHHTPEELEYGHSQNSQLITMPLEEVCEKVGLEIKPEDIGKTFVAYPTNNGINLFMDFCPAYEYLPDGVDGEFVEVEIEID